MTLSAPRFHPRLIRAIHRLDDESVPIAEVWRRVGAWADRSGSRGPDMTTSVAIVRAERDRRAELRQIRNDVAGTLLTGQTPDPVDALDRLAAVKARDRRRPGRSRRAS